MNEQKNAQVQRRKARLGAALRENLKRRKAQARSRAGGPGSAEARDSAGIVQHKDGD
jgi:hypothetical protein